MAITNASDLLVYAKTTGAVKQVTRIFVKKVNPIELPDDATQGTLKINNITNNSGAILDNQELNSANNTGPSVMSQIATKLVTDNGYSFLNVNHEFTIDGVVFTANDFTNGANGLVPTLEIVNGTATFDEGNIIVEILTPGSSEIFDPVSFATNAAFSSTVETRDITHKDSGGFTEVMSSTKSFEISSESLQTINPDTPLDGTDFFHELKERDKVKLAFSDRIRNIIRTNLTQSGVDGFSKLDITQTNLQSDPFGGSTASKIEVATSSNQFRNLNYRVDSTRLEGKNVTWTFYVKADSTSSVTFYADIIGASDIAPSKIEILEGSQTSSDITNSNRTLGNLNATYTRIRLTYNNMSLSGSSAVAFRVFPGASQSSQTVGDSVFVSSWQIEFSDEATDYQDPTTIKSFQGEALVTSVSYDAGVEDNLTCSATFTGTGDIFINGLGPELIGDTEFNLPNPVDGTLNPASAYWEIENTGATANSRIENSLAKFFINGATSTAIKKLNILNDGDRYLLTYTIPSNSPSTGALVLQDASENDIDIFLDITEGTHKVQFVSKGDDFVIKRSGTSANVFMSSISLKKVF